MPNETQAGAATRADIARGMREHYELISMAQCDWHSGIPQAIDAWEQAEAAEAERDRLRAALEHWQNTTRNMVLGHQAGILDGSLALAVAIKDMREAGMFPWAPTGDALGSAASGATDESMS